MYLKIENLILVNSKEFDLIDKKTGAKVKQVKYEFLKEDGSLMLGFLKAKDPVYEKEIRTVSGWNEKITLPYAFIPKEWEGKTKFQLVPGNERNKALKEFAENKEFAE